MIQVRKVLRLARFGQEEYKKHEQDAMLAGDGEDGGIKCFDVNIGKGLPLQAVKQAREQELKCLRELRVCEKVDEHAALAKYHVTPIDTKWVDTGKAFEEEPMQIRSRIIAREIRSADKPDLYAGILPPEALKAIKSVAASHSPQFPLMHVDVSRAYFHAKAQRLDSDC